MNVRRWLAAALCSAAAATAAPLARAGDGQAPPAASAPSGDATAAQKFADQGDLLREEGKWLEAAKAYGNALDAYEGHWAAHVRRQACAITIGEDSGLVKEYDELVQSRPDDPLAKLHRLRLDPPPSRIEALNGLLRTTSARRETQIEIGRASLASGDVAGAKKALEAAWSEKPDEGEWFSLSAEALRRSGDGAGARTRLEATVKQSPGLYEVLLQLARLDLLEKKNEDAMKRAEAALAIRPSHVVGLLLRSEAASRLGKAEEARSSIETALRVCPDDPDALVALADLTAKGASEQGLTKALDLYKKALSSKRVSQLRGYYGLGWVQERLAQLPEARSSYAEAGQLAPSDAGVMNSVGVVLLKQKRFSDAIVQFKKAIDADPLGPEAYSNMAAVYDEQAEWNDAIKWYVNFLALKGQDKNVRALLCCAFDYEAISAYKKAEDLLEKVVALRPEDAEVRTFYGDNQFFQHKWKIAVKAYQEAARLDEKNRFAWRGLGLALSEDDKPQDAVVALERAKALKTDDIPTVYELGNLYRGKECHDLQKAIDNYEAYVKAGGSDGDVPGIIEELKKELEAEKKNAK